MIWLFYLRARRGDGPTVYGPKADGHHTEGMPCPACGEPLLLGQATALVPLEPGDDPETRERWLAGRWCSATAIECHAACATGEEGR